MTDEIRNLTAEELDHVDGGLRIGPFHIEWSAGCGCVDIGWGSAGIWFGSGKAGWYNGDRAGSL